MTSFNRMKLQFQKLTLLLMMLIVALFATEQSEADILEENIKIFCQTCYKINCENISCLNICHC